MKLDQVSCGADAPNEVNVIIEIPANSGPVKYEIEEKTGALFVDRFMATAMFYPCNYGYVPQTLSDDGDPVDVLVVTPYPLISGSVIAVRPVGLLAMEDEKGNDAKILAVPLGKLCKHYNDIQGPEDIPGHLLSSISHFFEHYKDLEEDKWVKLAGWQGSEEAKQEIVTGMNRYGTIDK